MNDQCLGYVLTISNKGHQCSTGLPRVASQGKKKNWSRMKIQETSAHTNLQKNLNMLGSMRDAVRPAAHNASASVQNSTCCVDVLLSPKCTPHCALDQLVLPPSSRRMCVGCVCIYVKDTLVLGAAQARR